MQLAQSCRLIHKTGELLNHAMKSRKLSKRDLAYDLSIGEGWAGIMLSGNHNFTLRTLGDVAEVLGYKVELSLTPMEECGENRSL